MFRRSFLTALTGFVVAAAAAVPARAHAPVFTPTKWVELGEQTVSSRADRDVLILGADEGRYEALKFKVFGNRVAIAQVKVVFGNGQYQYLDVKEHMQPGETSQAYDLDKRHTIINRIEFLYQSENRWGDAVIKVMGKKDIGGVTTGCTEPSGGWTVLGRRDVNSVTD